MSRLTSEAAFLACIDRHFPNRHPHVVQGRGDDCAILACPALMSLSSDLFLEDVHFRRSYFSPADIGYKALAVNLSDIAATGGVPLGFSLGIMVPPSQADGAEAQEFFQASADSSGEEIAEGADPYWDAFFAGMAELAREHNVALTGGDLSRSPMMGVSIAVWGKQAEGKGGVAPFMQRGGSAPGDVIFIVGDFGLARVGLLALESMGRHAQSLYPRAVQAHLRPVPRVAEGQTIARFDAECAELADSKTGIAGGKTDHCGIICLMDLSDGLARDLPRLLGSDRGNGMCAELVIDRESVHSEISAYCLANDLDPLEQAVLGGEDYALIGTCPAAHMDALKVLLPHAQVLGTVSEGDVHMLNGMPWEARGFDHFA